VMADLGCGECWYTSKIYNHFLNKQESVNIYGIDISKTALIAGAKRCGGIKSAVASISDLPIPDECCDAVISIFAPYSADEVLRIVKRNGVFIKAVPLERHLIEFKSVIYDRPYENKVELEKLDGFKLINQTRVEKEIHLSDREDIMNLFKMTPYYYKTGRDDQQKISMLTSLDTTAQFLVETFIKSV
ncbi:MAG: methyltransferase domain-containing protein, partial [Clostridia bacterium]|nr:methyltransferase domain-containing protein [Clostridia bacterium]